MRMIVTAAVAWATGHAGGELLWVCRNSRLGDDRELVGLTGRDVTVTNDLKAGDAQATVWTNDLSCATPDTLRLAPPLILDHHEVEPALAVLAASLALASSGQHSPADTRRRNGRQASRDTSQTSLEAT